MSTNWLLDEGLISLVPNDNEPKAGHAFALLADRPSVIMWSDVGCGELRITTWLDYNKDKNPYANGRGASKESFGTSLPLGSRLYYPKFVGVTVSAFLERQEGRHLQGRGRDKLFDVYTRPGEEDALAALPETTPHGFAAEGIFYM